MKSTKTILAWLYSLFATCFVNAAPLPPIWGEWTGIFPPHAQQPNEHKWVLTFYPEMLFSVDIFEGAIQIPGFSGSYECESTNLFIDLYGKGALSATREMAIARREIVPVSYTLTNKTLDLSSLSDLVWSLGGGEGVTHYARTKSAAQIPPVTDHATLKGGYYKMQLTLSPYNDKAALKRVFGEQYTNDTVQSIDYGTFPVFRVKDAWNEILLPENRFGIPSFNGTIFKAKMRVGRECLADFTGKTVSDTKIVGSFKSTQPSIAGTFIFDRVKSFDWEPPEPAPEPSTTIFPATAYYGEWNSTTKGQPGIMNFEGDGKFSGSYPEGKATGSWNYLPKGSFEIVVKGGLRREGYLASRGKLVLLPPEQFPEWPPMVCERVVESPTATQPAFPIKVYYGKWHATIEGRSGTFELRKGGGLLVTSPGGVTTGNWHYLKSGRIELISGDEMKLDGALTLDEKHLILVSPGMPEITCKRVKEITP